jgi:tetratricopeptide (TPR) repeat protein
MRSLHKKIVISEDRFSTQTVESKLAFEPWTFAQQLIRYDLLDFILQMYREGNLTKENPILLEAINRMEEYVAREPNFPNYFFLIGKAYDKLSDLHNNNIVELEKAESAYRKGLALSPYRQDGRYALAINLMNQGREEESRLLIQETLAQNNTAPETYYYFGLLEIKWKKPDYVKSLSYMEFALNEGVNPSKKITNQIYQIYFNHFYEKKDVDNFLIVLKRKMVLDPTQAQAYKAISQYIEINRKIPVIDLIK